MTDPIADFLTRIRNGYLARKTEVAIPYSKFKQSLAKILKDAGYITDFSINKSGHSELILNLRYLEKLPALTQISRLSKPGQRLYTRSHNLKPILSGQGIVVVSTPRGLMTNSQARKAGLGGELICKIW